MNSTWVHVGCADENHTPHTNRSQKTLQTKKPAPHLQQCVKKINHHTHTKNEKTKTEFTDKSGDRLAER
jgi:hypothetical protein